MQKNRLGNSALEVSQIGLGCMSLGTNEHNARDIVKRALELGVNYFDTADLYDLGENEKIVGNALRGQRDNVILATKAGNRWIPGQDGWEWDPSKKHIHSAIKDSLHRLKTDYIDLYQLHGGTIEDPTDETIDAFEELKKEGLIREYGISSIRPNVIKRFIENSSIISVMMQFSMLDNRPEEWLELFQTHNVGIIARGPLAKGLLSDEWNEKLKTKYAGKGYMDYSDKDLSEILPKLKDIIGDRSLEAAAFHYCLSQPSVAAVIPGASSIEQLEANVRAIQKYEFSIGEMKQLQGLLKQTVYKEHRQ
ncbi:aldo/keto reductase [Sutcliffiella rhizosphaerae]|uniref:aldo/keto reductase n=1 Tax=Sutcliffiella rhizosphaerae TaxID=2880967 RepID=UPI001E33FF6F|nr:aldo/keto reductase [Sutcliffiella rhizosphaerae]